MRRTLAALTILSLCLPVVAEAQPSHRDHRGREAASDAGPQGRNARPDRNEARGPALAENRDNRDSDRDRRDRNRRDFDRGRDFRDDRDGRDGRDGRRHFNYRGRQYAAVRGAAFHYPRGWAYRHWNRGELLPRVFVAAPYFIDYGYLGLPPPPPNYRWVRYGPDALLVNVYDERIIDVIYDAFY